jgi:hypothetical protein
MPLTPEEAQEISNLHLKVLANVAGGKPPHDGISQDEVKRTLDLLRKDRAAALSAGSAGKPKKSRAAAPKVSNLNESLASKFPGLNLD